MTRSDKLAIRIAGIWILAVVLEIAFVAIAFARTESRDPEVFRAYNAYFKNPTEENEKNLRRTLDEKLWVQRTVQGACLILAIMNIPATWLILRKTKRTLELSEVGTEVSPHPANTQK